MQSPVRIFQRSISIYRKARLPNAVINDVQRTLDFSAAFSAAAFVRDGPENRAFRSSKIVVRMNCQRNTANS